MLHGLKLVDISCPYTPAHHLWLHQPLLILEHEEPFPVQRFCMCWLCFLKVSPSPQYYKASTFPSFSYFHHPRHGFYHFTMADMYICAGSFLHKRTQPRWGGVIRSWTLTLCDPQALCICSKMRSFSFSWRYTMGQQWHCLWPSEFLLRIFHSLLWLY